jgi:hypothetical protein
MPINDLRRTPGDKGHSSKPTTHYGIEGESQRYMHSGPAGHTRRQHKLFPGQRQGHYYLPRNYERDMAKHKKSVKAQGKKGGRGRGTRSTRRR